MSSSSRPCSSATRNATLSTPSCTSLRSSMRDSSSGPISETVARTGWPCSPNTSQNTVENWSGWNVRPISPARLRMKSLASPTSAMPERSPLMSAANTGTPARANPSAITCSETVLPVPVAPVTRPWRLASAERQPGRLFALADEDLLVGIGHLVLGRRHCIASSRCSGGSVARRIISYCILQPIETVQRIASRTEALLLARIDCLIRSVDESSLRIRENLRNSLLHCCNTRGAIEDENRFRMR